MEQTKTIKIKFVGFWEGFTPERSLIYKILQGHYHVILSEQPDYILCSVFGNPYEYTKYSCVRIMHVGENYVPDFNLIDYAISRYPIRFQDRHFYLTGCADFVDDRYLQLQYKNRQYSREFLSSKTYFADFIYNHDSENKERSLFFKKLSKYGRVESAGNFMNNMIDGRRVNFLDGSKLALQKKCKFSICFEGAGTQIITEKISDAFSADSIPIYYGAKEIGNIFNKNAFINCADYASFDDVIEQVVRLDSNDEMYLKMLRQPIFCVDGFPEKNIRELEQFIYRIFDQPLEEAYRRSRIGVPLKYDHALKRCFTNVGSELLANIKQWKRRWHFVDRMQ